MIRQKMRPGLSRHALGAVIALSGGLSAVGPAFAQGTSNYGYHHGPGMMGSGGGFGWFMGPIMMLIFLMAAVAVVVLLIRWLGGADHHRPGKRGDGDTDALAVLEQRFARGEIDEEEFRKRKQILRE